MAENVIIRKLVDYLLLNGYSVNSTGFYNGKAGVSLCLFEVSGYLQDENIEEHAFELLQESLLSNNDDISFENGLSGIGYVLLYLIENKFIDADFAESFGENMIKINKGLEDIEKLDSKDCILFHFKIVFFLSLLLKHLGGECKLVKRQIDYFSRVVTCLLDDYMSEVEKSPKRYLKTELSNILETYLKIAMLCPSFTPSSELLNRYIKLYRQDKFICSLPIGYFLENLSLKWKSDVLYEVANLHRLSAVRNIYPETMSLSQRIDLLCLLRQYGDRYTKEISLLEMGFREDSGEAVLERNLLCCIDTAGFMAGYQSGIARLLYYWVNRHFPDRMLFNLI